MASQIRTSGTQVYKGYKEIFIESEADLTNLPQHPGKNLFLGSIAYDKNFNIWVLTSNGWEESE